MNRRNYIKTITLGALAPAFIPNTLSSNLIDGWKRIKKTKFKSNWQNWPDMKWIGPEYWANPLQNWELKNGRTICKVSQPNRNLHLLTLQKPSGLEALETSVKITPYYLDENISGSIGIRLGVKGPFADYRSAAVFGRGLSIGISPDYTLKINEKTIATNLKTTPNSVKLSVKAIPANKAYNIQISLIDPETEKDLFTDNSTTIQPEILEGGFALFSDFKKGTQTVSSVAFEGWEILGDQLYQNEEQLYGPICFAQYTLHNKKLKLTAQFTPIEKIKNHKVCLEFTSVYFKF